MKPLDYAILAVIAVWFVLAVRSIWKRRGSCCGCQGCTAEKEKILHSEKKRKRTGLLRLLRTVRKKRKLPLPLDSGNFDFGRQL